MKRMLTLNRRQAASSEVYVDIDSIDVIQDDGQYGSIIYIGGHAIAVRERASTIWGQLDLEQVQFITIENQGPTQQQSES